MAPVYPLANARLKSLTSIDEAFVRIAPLAGLVPGEEALTLAASLGRITAHDLFTEAALPRFDHSAMDGFGLCAIDLARPAPFDLIVSARVFAGGTPDSQTGR
jgi:molybdopterin molybdotransferase